MPDEQHASLYFRDDRSDKEYHADLVPQGDGWVVNYRYGPNVERRGGTLKAGTKTSAPVSYEKALKIFQALVDEKKGKGYAPGKAGVPFSGTELAGRDTAHRPQLLTWVDDPTAALHDDRFWAQQKLDGHRVLIEKRGRTVTGINRRGLSRALPESLVNTVASLPGDFVLDGELVGADYHPFDLPGPQPYSERLQRLERLWGDLPGLVQTARTTEEKLQLVLDLHKANAEGFVLKRHDAPYKAGRHETQLKHKFYSTASCIVLELNDKSSIQLALYDQGALRFVGNCTIPPNKDKPGKGMVVEIRYLYAFRGGSLFHPNFEGVRTDIAPEECTADQLKFKAGTEDDEESQ